MSQSDEPLSILPESLLRTLPPLTPGVRLRVLYFMRTIDCPVCRAHVRRLGELVPQLRTLGADAVAVAAPDGVDTAAEWIARQAVPVVASDDAHASAGLRRALLGIQRSGTLLIDQHGAVLYALRAVLPLQAFDERALVAELRRAATDSAVHAHA
jgi:peroxiredoxin